MPITNTANQVLRDIAKRIAEEPRNGTQYVVFDILDSGLDGLDVRHPDDFPAEQLSLREQIARAICNDDDWWNAMNEQHSSRIYHLSMAERVLSLVYRRASAENN